MPVSQSSWMLAMGMISINENLSLCGYNGYIHLHPSHELSLDNIRYHKSNI